MEVMCLIPGNGMIALEGTGIEKVVKLQQIGTLIEPVNLLDINSQLGASGKSLSNCFNC